MNKLLDKACAKGTLPTTQCYSIEPQGGTWVWMNEVFRYVRTNHIKPGVTVHAFAG